MKSLTISHLVKKLLFSFVITVSILLVVAQTSQSLAAQKTNPLAKVDIHDAVIKNDIATIKQLITLKSNLNVKEPYGGSTPLISAALFGKTEIAQLLIDAGADLNIQNNDGSTALITAAFFCRTEIVKMLLAKKANKVIKNKYGQTAYDTVVMPYSDAKQSYDILGTALAPMGLKLDYQYIVKTRPVIAQMLK